MGVVYYRQVSCYHQISEAGWKEEFIVVAFNLVDKIFIVHVLSLASSNNVHFSCKIQKASLKVNEALTTIFSEYCDFADIFSLKLAIELSEYTEINNYVINLINGK